MNDTYEVGVMETVFERRLGVIDKKYYITGRAYASPEDKLNSVGEPGKRTASCPVSEGVKGLAECATEWGMFVLRGDVLVSPVVHAEVGCPSILKKPMNENDFLEFLRVVCYRE